MYIITYKGKPLTRKKLNELYNAGYDTWLGNDKDFIAAKTKQSTITFFEDVFSQDCDDDFDCWNNRLKGIEVSKFNISKGE